MAYSAQRVPRPCRAVYTFFRFVGIADIAAVERADSQEMGILFVAQILPPKSGDAADLLVTFNFQLTNFQQLGLPSQISVSPLVPQASYGSPDCTPRPWCGTRQARC